MENVKLATHNLRTKKTVRSRSFSILNSQFSILIIALAMMGCNPLEKMSIVEAPMPRIAGTEAIEGALTVKNDSGSTLTVETATIAVKTGGRTLATAHLAEAVEVAARKTSKVDYRFELGKVSRGDLQTLGLLALMSPNKLTLDIEAQARVGCFHKKVAIKNTPVSEILRTFGR